MTDLPTKTCAKCAVEKRLTAFHAKQRTCIDCVQAAKARTLERKEAVAWSPELGERIVDMLAAGMPVAEVCAQTAMPTPRQLRAWRRGNPEFDAACQAAEQASAAAHLNKAKEVLVKVETGKLSASDGRMLFDGHVKLATLLDPSRYGTHATVDLSSGGKPLVSFVEAVEALIAVLPQQAALPPPIDVEATDVPERATLQ